MSILSSFRLPYREDKLFGPLFLMALLVPLAFDFYNFESFEIIKFGLMALLAGLAALGFFKKYFLNPSAALVLRGRRAFFLGIALFLVWALASSFAAVDANYSFFGFYPRFTSGFLFYFLWSVLFFLLAGLSREQVWFLLKVFFACGGLIAMWGILQSIGIGYYAGVSPGLFTRSAPSFLGNPNFSSMFMAAVVPLGVYFFCAAKSFPKKIYYALSLVLQIGAVVILASRGAIIALLGGLVVCLVFSLIFRRDGFRKSVLFYGLSVALLLFFIWMFLGFARPGTVTATISLKETNVQQRFGIWGLAVKGIQEKPVLGHGLGNFEVFFEKNRQLSTVKAGFFDDPHNLFLYLAATGGVPFLFLFLFLVLYAPVLELKKVIQGNTGQEGGVFALFGSLAAWLAASFFTPVAIPCYLLLAFLISAFFGETVTYKVPKAALFKTGGKLFSWALIVCALIFITAEHLFFAGIRYYNRGDFSKSYSYVRLATYLNPSNSLYYEYLAGSAIRAGAPLEEVEKNISAFGSFHTERSYTYIQLANVHYLLLYRTQDPAYRAPVLENLYKAIAMDPYSANNYFSLSQYLMAFGDLEGAANAVNKGISLDNTNVETWVFLAKIRQLQGNRELAIEALESAVLVADDKVNLINLVGLAKATPNIRDVPFGIHLALGKLD